MIRSIFLKLNYFIKWLVTFTLNMPLLIKEQFNSILQNFNSLKYNIKNLAQSNIKLGVYHLGNQNYNDAIFRFKMVDKFLRPNDPFVNYQLGLVYFLKKDYKQAIEYLEKGKSGDKTGLLDFIRNINNLVPVPEAVRKVHRDIIAADIIAKFTDDTQPQQDLAQILVSSLIGALSGEQKEYKILEFGSNIGLVGGVLNARMSEKFELTGVETSAQMIYLQSTYGSDRFYGQVLNLANDEYLNNCDKEQKYDIALSLDGFASNPDLDEFFTKVYEVLYSEGYFAFVIRTGSTLNFSEKYLEFSYNKNYIYGSLQKAGFKVIVDSDLGIIMKNNYSIFICRK